VHEQPLVIPCRSEWVSFPEDLPFWVAARVAGGLSLALWIGVVVSGRMIAYNWFDCDRQPQPEIINFLTSCVPSE